MGNIQLLTNTGKQGHSDVLIQYLNHADETWMATAFLKQSGLDLLLPAFRRHLKAGKGLQLVAGQHFGLTEPGALQVLHDLFKPFMEANLYLDKAADKQKIFHPKLFLFRQGTTGIIISGSANITGGGLACNEEFSVGVEVAVSSPQWKSALEYFNRITSQEYADPVTLLLIKQYEAFYQEQKKLRKKQKAVPAKKSGEYHFDYHKLKEWLKEYRDDSYEEKFIQRGKNYRKAKQLLNEIADSNRLSQARFEEIIDELVGKSKHTSLWYSGSLLRLRLKVHQCKNEFRTLVTFIKQNQGYPATRVFSGAKELVKQVEGAGINYVTEIMMTYQPDRFANLNANPIAVLKKEAGVYFKSHSSSFHGEDYEAYCNQVLEICEKLGLRNMLEADSFFNDIYWKLKKSGRLS